MAEPQPSLARAHLRGARISARKVRLVADQIRGKPVADALDLLTFQPLKSARMVRKLLVSAVANAENNHQLDADMLKIGRIFVDEGLTMKRLRPRARGRADRYFKRSCHISIHLSPLRATGGGL